MSNKKQRKKRREDPWNRRVLTLDQALELALSTTADDDIVRKYPAAKAVAAICDRLGCRFTGPGNFNRLTYGERMVWDLTYMQGEILNGGFHQYLTNSTGETGEEVKKYLKRIGATQTLELFRRLSKIFPRGIIPKDREQRCRYVKPWEDQETNNDIFEELDSNFYEQSEKIDELILNYVRNNLSDFSEPSDEIVQRLKRKDKIKRHYFGTAVPEWIEGAEKALQMLTELAETELAKAGDKKLMRIKAKISAGKRAEAIVEYRKLFQCSLAEAKAGVDRLAKE